MGRDKAFLPLGGGTLAGRVASAVAAAAGSATLVGDPARYAALGWPVIADRHRGAGPLAGIHAALLATAAEWNLVLACDMPLAGPAFLRQLLETAGNCASDCLVPRLPGGRLEPLCAVYRRACAGPIGEALAGGVRKVADGLAGLRVAFHDVTEVCHFVNLNTPEDWAAHGRE
jgi:molybdopterin-guanine dinucleotide biosynthesis protein A